MSGFRSNKEYRRRCLAFSAKRSRLFFDTKVNRVLPTKTDVTSVAILLILLVSNERLASFLNFVVSNFDSKPKNYLNSVEKYLPTGRIVLT